MIRVGCVPLLIVCSIGWCANLFAQQASPAATQVKSWTESMSSGVKAVAEERFADAEKSFKSAIELVKDEKDDPRLPAAINNLGALYQRQGRYDEAAPLHRQALELREKILGQEHPDVAQSLNNLATVYVEQRRYAEAVPLYERAISIWKKTRGDDYYKIGAALNNLATLHEAQGQYDEAKRLYDESLALWGKNRGANDLLYAQSLENYAGLLRRINDQAGAAKAQSEAKAIRTEVRKRETSSI